MKNITGCSDVPHEASPSTKKPITDDQNAGLPRSASMIDAITAGGESGSAGPGTRVVLVSPLSLLPGVSYQLANPFADPDDCFANIKCSHWLFAKAVLKAGRYGTVSMNEIEVTIAT
jgi:hypothetical protein